MSDRTFLLQDWITVRSSLNNPFIQDPKDWLDLAGFADAAYWIDVTEITPPAAGASLQLLLETAPTCDDFVNASAPAQSWFQPTTGPILLGTATQFTPASATPFVINSVRSASTVSLSRYLRWRIVPSTTGTWDVTFRIRVVANRSGFLVPTDIPGCVLWLRSDLGVALSGSGANMSSWGDQSGNGNNASAGGTSVPIYKPSGGINNLPRVTGTTSGYFTGSLPSVSEHTLFVVVSYPALSNAAAFAGTISHAVNSGFAQFTETTTGIIGRAGASPTSFSSAVANDSTSLATLGSPGIYSTAASSKVGSNNGTVDLYVNGVNPPGANTSTTFTLASTTDYVLFDLAVPSAGYTFAGDAYEHVLFNRVLTAAERRRVHRYLGGRYGIQVP